MDAVTKFVALAPSRRLNESWDPGPHGLKRNNHGIIVRQAGLIIRKLLDAYFQFAKY